MASLNEEALRTQAPSEELKGSIRFLPPSDDLVSDSPSLKA